MLCTYSTVTLTHWGLISFIPFSESLNHSISKVFPHELSCVESNASRLYDADNRKERNWGNHFPKWLTISTMAIMTAWMFAVLSLLLAARQLTGLCVDFKTFWYYIHWCWTSNLHHSISIKVSWHYQQLKSSLRNPKVYLLMIISLLVVALCSYC